MPIGSLLRVSDYFRQSSSARPIRLAMAMCVKNESDIIQANIEYHFKKGVDAFFILDNYSSDGTYEILKNLEKIHPLHLYRSGEYNQAAHMTFLTNEARKSGFDWVIENDADEFWRPESGNLKDGLERKSPMMSIRRRNIIPDHMAMTIGPSSRKLYRTETPIEHDWKTCYTRNPDINYLLADVSNKVMVNTHGFIDIKFGNHRAKHIAMKWPIRRPVKDNENILIYHFMIRTYNVFLKRVQAMHANYTSGQMKTKQGQAWYWNTAYEQGNLQQAYNNMTLTKEKLEYHLLRNQIVHDNCLYEIFDDYRKYNPGNSPENQGHRLFELQ